MKQDWDVLIVGAGAAGLMCGIQLGRAGFSVLILDKNNKIGKKLAATGNGRCNFTNLNMNADCYYGEPALIHAALEFCPPEKLIAEMERLGIYYRQKEGYVYPYTNQAATVVEQMQKAAGAWNVTVVPECLVKKIQKTDKRFTISTDKGQYYSRYVVLATGGAASRELGGDLCGYALAKKFGHSVTALYPGLTGLIAAGDFWNRVAGTRIQGRFSLQIDDEVIAGEEGEIQITKSGVSGIPVFQMCRLAAEGLQKGKKVRGMIDFIPPMDPMQVEHWVKQYGFDGLVPAKWIPIIHRAKRPEKILKSFSFEIKDTMGLERAQVTAGGIPAEEVQAKTCESKFVPGLYLLGELLDVDGKCGGYNLHFAFATAMMAATALIEKKET